MTARASSSTPRQGATATGSSPAQIRFAASSRIAPSFHVGPRSYAAGGVILHPLHGHFALGDPTIFQARAGMGPVHAAVGAMLQYHPHPYSINGRQPG